MGLMDWFKPNTEERGFSGGILSNFGGVSVDKDSALTYSAVYACVRVLSESIASLPINVYNNDNGKQKDTDHPINSLITKKPNAIMTSYKWREVMMMNLVLRGNAFFLIQRDKKTNRPISLDYIDNDLVEVHQSKGQLVYVIAGERKRRLASEVLHFKGLGFDGTGGISVIRLHKETIGLSISANKYGGDFFKKASKPSGVLKHPGRLTKEAAERLRDSWGGSYSGLSNMHKTAILEDGMDWKPITINPQDADFLNTRKFQVNEIARIFRVPPHMIGDLDRATFSNIEQQGIDFVMHTLRPYITNIEEELNEKLFMEREQSTHYVKLNVNGLMRGDAKSRMEFYKGMFEIGALSPNDIRALEDLNAIDDGDQYFRPLNFTNLNSDTNEQRD